jgi:hypothetical protein
MNVRTGLLALAAAVTTFLLFGAAAIAVLGGRFGESPGVGILGVAAGALAAAVALVAVAVLADRFRGVPRAALVAYGTFGVAFLAIAAMQYVDVPGADDLFAFEVHLAVSLVAAVVTGAVTLARPGRGPGVGRTA